MATTANLQVKISADSAKLSQGLSKAKRSVKGFAKSAVKDLAKIATVLTASMAAATAAVTAVLNATAKDIDKLAKTSSKLGVPIQELQKLQFAAELSGVGTDTLNMALQRMVRRVGEAAQGTGEAVSALQELGIDAKNLARLSPDQQFQKISKAFAKIGTQGDKVRLAFKIFDSEGVALVNTMSQDLDKLGKEFEELGLGLTDAQGKAVEAFNDSKTKLGRIFKAIKEQAIAALAPAFEQIITKIKDFIVEMGGVKPIALNVAKAVLTSIDAMVTGFAFLGKVVLGLNTVFDGLQVAIGMLAKNVARTMLIVNRELSQQEWGQELGIRLARSVGVLTGDDNLAAWNPQREAETREAMRAKTAELERMASFNPQAERGMMAESVQEFEKSFQKLIDFDRGTKSGGGLIGSLQTTVDQELSKLDMETKKASNSLKGFAEIVDATGRSMSIGSKDAQQTAKGGFGVITGADGRTLSAGNVPQEVKVSIQAEDGLTAKVVNSPMNRNKIIEVNNDNLDRERVKNVR